MSLIPLFMDGFEQYTSASLANYNANSPWNAVLTVGSSSGRFGSIGCSSVNTFGPVVLPSTTIVGGVGFAVNPQGSTATNLLILYDAAGTVQGGIVRNADYSLSVTRGGTVLGTSAAGILPLGVYNHVEAQCKVDPTTGTWDIWVNGVCVLSLNSLNTRGSSVVGSGVSRFSFMQTGQSALFDDIHVYDATSRTGASGAGTPASCTFEHYGDKRIQTLFPSAAGTGDVGTFTQVGGTGGSPFTAVNERPQNGDTSYVADSVAGDIKSFALDDLAAGTTGVVAVAAVACFEKDDAAARTVAVGIRTSSTNAFGTTRGSPSSYVYTEDIFTLDGAGAALTPTGVNGTEILFKVVS
jgi:hypothetical protein